MDEQKLPSWEETLARLERAVKLGNKVVSITRGKRRRVTDAQRKKILKVALEALIRGLENKE